MKLHCSFFFKVRYAANVHMIVVVKWKVYCFASFL